MDKSRQQEEALAYFRKAAQVWRQEKTVDSPSKFNVPRARNEFVIQVAQETGARRSLDVGCGTGDLVLALAGVGVSATGLDFSPEMIDLAAGRANRQGLGLARFICASVLDQTFDEPFDLVSANGLIEYFSAAEMERFGRLVGELVRPGGSLVVGSRNRLLNVLSLNQYTSQEIERGQAEALLAEAVVISEAPSQREMIEGLRRIRPARLQAESLPASDVEGDTEVTNRIQYTPAQLIQFLEALGFEVARVGAINVHAAVPRFKHAWPEVHTEMAYLLEKFADRITSLIPFGSTFMVWARAS